MNLIKRKPFRSCNMIHSFHISLSRKNPILSLIEVIYNSISSFNIHKSMYFEESKNVIGEPTILKNNSYRSYLS